MTKNGNHRLDEALLALIGGRVQVEARLDELRALVARMTAGQPLPEEAALELERIARRLDADLGSQATAAHDIRDVLAEMGLVSAESAPVRPVLLVRCGDRKFALPLESVEKISLAADAVPRLAALLELPAGSSDGLERTLILRSGGEIVVDEVLRQDELVVHGLGPLLADAAAYLGLAAAPELTPLLNPEWLEKQSGNRVVE